MRKIHEKIKKDKQDPKRLKRQPQYFKINIDAAKAFDSMRRDKITKLLIEKGMDRTLVNAIKETLNNTTMRISDEDVKTYIGVPQGSILSPTLFNLAIDNILTDNNIKSKLMGYSDDLSAVVEGQLPMFLMLKNV
jgi:response regulator of citrate/malate metabolism